eukprot:scaffold2956_cov390-Prasinococcus_capsulatus_cf.AAC.9
MPISLQVAARLLFLHYKARSLQLHVCFIHQSKHLLNIPAQRSVTTVKKRGMRRFGCSNCFGQTDARGHIALSRPWLQKSHIHPAPQTQ